MLVKSRNVAQKEKIKIPQHLAKDTIVINAHQAFTMVRKSVSGELA